MFASKPMRKVERAETAAVVVIRSRWTSATQLRYVVSEVQPSPVGHTQVPPESEMIAALTEIYEKKEESSRLPWPAAIVIADGRCTPWQPV